MMQSETNLNEAERAITETEAAELMGLSKKTLQNHRVAGRGCPYLKLSGRAVRYLVSDIQDYLMSKRIVPGEGGVA